MLNDKLEVNNAKIINLKFIDFKYIKDMSMKMNPHLYVGSKKGGKMKKRNIWFVSTVILIENIFFMPNKAEASLDIKDFLAEVGFYTGIVGTIIGGIAGIYKVIKTCCSICCVKPDTNNTFSESEEPETQYTDSNWDDIYNVQDDTENNINQKLSKNKNSSSGRFARSKTVPVPKMSVIDEI